MKKGGFQKKILSLSTCSVFGSREKGKGMIMESFYFPFKSLSLYSFGKSFFLIRYLCCILEENYFIVDIPVYEICID